MVGEFHPGGTRGPRARGGTGGGDVTVELTTEVPEEEPEERRRTGLLLLLW